MPNIPKDLEAIFSRYEVSTSCGSINCARLTQHESCNSEFKARIAAYTTNKFAVTEGDLAWCLGKLRGLGHPNEALEKKYGMTGDSKGE